MVTLTEGHPHDPDQLVPAADDVTVLHVDMDAFYASVSLIERPELRGLPVVIGGGWRSVVLSATYEARAYGLRSGMPMATARRLCPAVVVVRPDADSYSRVSEAVMAIFAEVTPVVEPVSLEEAFLDVSAARRQWGGPARIGQWIRDTVADEQQITCSVGGAPSKAVAKMASRAAKPDGMRLLTRGEVVPFLHPMPVGALWGVGEATETELRRLGLHTVADLAHLEATDMIAFSMAFARVHPQERLIQLHGFDSASRKTAVAQASAAIVSAGHPEPSAELKDAVRCLKLKVEQSTRLYGDDVQELGGTTNAIGRALRTVGYVHFVHLELNRSLRERLLRDTGQRRLLFTCLGGQS